MSYSVKQIIEQFLTHKRTISNCYFANNDSMAPKLAYQVDFPRLEIIIEGEQNIQWDNNGHLETRRLLAGDVLFVSAKSWNKPIWDKPTTTLSLLFGKQQLGISLLHWNGMSFIPYEQLDTARRGPRVGAFIIQALSELTLNEQALLNQTTASLLVKSLLSHSLDLLNSNIQTSPRTTSLYEAIRQYIDSHFKENLTRDFLADLFHISPNYLSSLFHKEGKIGLNEYIIQIKLEHAKVLLKKYDLNIKEVALASGFNDSNYFCRIFKKKTARSPSEYRRQYHSKLYNKIN